jgi:hypothetical protein
MSANGPEKAAIMPILIGPAAAGASFGAGLDSSLFFFSLHDAAPISATAAIALRRKAEWSMVTSSSRGRG